jgi:hypothetical protein
MSSPMAESTGGRMNSKGDCTRHHFSDTFVDISPVVEHTHRCTTEMGDIAAERLTIQPAMVWIFASNTADNESGVRWLHYRDLARSHR